MKNINRTMKEISIEEFLGESIMEYKQCEYYACGKIFILTRKDKKFCNRECKNSNRKMKKYYKNTKRKE